MKSSCRVICRTALLLAIAGVSLHAHAQEYPNKTIRVITGTVAGGTDFSARLIASSLATALGHPVVVENRASAIVVRDAVIKAPPDGYTLMFYASSIWLLPFLQSDVVFDPLKDFAPIALVAGAPTILVVNPSLPVSSVKELIAYAKARPGQLNYSSGNSGNAPHLAAELFKAMAGVHIVRIAYRGGGPAVTALVAGEVQLSFATAGAGVSFVKSGRLKALGVTSAKPSALFPGLPTVASSGLPGYEAVSTYGMLAAARTPAAIIARLNQEIVKMLGQSDIKEKFLASGLETIGGTPEEFRAVMAAEMAGMGKVIKEAGITGD